VASVPNPTPLVTRALKQTQTKQSAKNRDRLTFPRCAVCCVLCYVSPFIPIHSHLFPFPFPFLFPFLFNLNGVCCVCKEAPPAVGEAPDLMTNPEMAALVAPIDEAIFFPFYGQVNVTNAKFRWYKTGQLETKSQSFYAVLVACCLLPVAYCLLPIAYCLLPASYLFEWCRDSAHS